MTPADTTPYLVQKRAEWYRHLTAAEKSSLVGQMCTEARELARSGISRRHPAYSADETEQALKRLWVGDRLADRVWPAHKHLVP